MNLGVVAHFHDRAEGTGGYVVELVRRLATRHQVTLYVAAAPTAAPEGVRLVRVPALRRPAYAAILSFPAAFASVRRRHDIVHAQGWVTGRADVVTSHIVLAAWRDAARRAGIAPPAGEALFGGLVERREARLLSSGCRAVIAPSGKARDEIAACYGRREGVHVVPHGFPAPRPRADKAGSRCRLGLDAERFLALWAGDARKGLRPALEGLAGVPAVGLLVASRSPRPVYVETAIALGVADRVTWLAQDTPVEDAYAAADVLVHPTIYDTFGLVVAEAMAAGLPVVVSREAGVAERLQHGRSAWVLPSTEATDLAEAIAALAADRGLRQRLAAEGRGVAAARSWDAVAEETEEVYAEVAAG